MTRSFGAALQTWSGLILGAAAWIANTQLGEILPYRDCGASLRASFLSSAAMAVVALTGAGLSFGVRRGSKSDKQATARFNAGLSALGGLVFAFAIGLQGAASWLLTGCER
jgi:hypothetical protein